MGVTETRFWRLTPRQLWALLARWEAAEKRQDARAGQIAATIANRHRSREEDPYTPSDFFPSLREPPREQTVEEQALMLEMLRAVFGGKDLRPRDADGKLLPRGTIATAA